MKKQFLSYISIFLFALLASCEKEVKTSHSESKSVCFYLSTTRATDVEFEKGDAIGVFAAARDDESVPAPLKSSGNFADNKKYIFDGEKFVPDGESNSIFITSYPIDYYTYYPYSTISNPLEFEFHVAVDQSNLTLSDLMYAKNTDGTGKNNIPLTFTHKLSKVVVPYSLENVEEEAGSATINQAYTGSIINLSTGEIHTLVDEGPQDLVMSKDFSSDIRFTAIFPEQTFSATHPFITFNNSKEFKLSSDRLFESGHISELPFMGKMLEYQFEVTPIEKNIASKGGTFDLAIASKKYYSVNGTLIPGTENLLDYSYSTSVNWITFDKSTLKVTVAENADPNNSRTGVIILKQVESNKQITCTVIQSAGELTYGDWTVTISASPTTIAAAGGSSTLTYSAVRNVLTNGTVTGTEKATPTISGSGTGFTRSGATVTAANNTTTSSRSVTYTATHGGKSATCTITQSAGSKQYASWSDWTVTVSANPTTIARTGGTSTITRAATRTRAWTWNGVSGSGGTETDNGTPTLSASGTGFTLSGTTLTASNNTTTSSRSCTVTATHAGKSATCTVTQSAGEITYGDWTVTISANPSTIAAAGGSSTLTYSAVRNVLTNGTVTGTEKATPTISGSGTGFTRSGATVTAANNTTTSSRSVTYTATHGGKSATCTITQSAGSTTTEYGSWTTNSLTVSASPNPVAASGGNSTLSCKANQTRPKYTKWNGITTNTTSESQSIAVTASWSKVSGSGSLSGSTVSFGNNTSTSSLSGTYRASYGGKTGDVSVSQSAGSTTTEYGSWTTNSLTVSASPNPVAASGGNSTLSCKANQTRPKYTKWNGITTNTTSESQSIAVTASWSKVSGSGSLSGSTVSFGNNTSTSSLSGTYRASYGGKTGDVSVSQSAGSTTTEYGSWTTNSLTVSASPNPVAASGGSSTLSCKANQTRPKYTKWNGITTSTTSESQSVAVTATWSKVSGTGSLSGSTVSFDNNTTTSARSGVYRASSGGKTADVTVSQYGGTITYTYTFTLTGGATSTSWSGIAASGESKSFSIISTRTVLVNGISTGTENVSYSGSSNVSWASVSGSTVTVGDNPNATARGGSITFTQANSGKTITVTLVQLKKNSVDIN